MAATLILQVIDLSRDIGSLLLRHAAAQPRKMNDLFIDYAAVHFENPNVTIAFCEQGIPPSLLAEKRYGERFIRYQQAYRDRFGDDGPMGEPQAEPEAGPGMRR